LEGAAGLTYAAKWSANPTETNWVSLVDSGLGGTHQFKLSTTGHPMLFVRFKIIPAGPSDRDAGKPLLHGRLAPEGHFRKKAAPDRVRPF